MSKHAGPRPERSPGGTPTGPFLGYALGIVATLVAWGVLVSAAIEFGREARTGEGAAWIFLALATIGAAACLFLTILLGMRVIGLVRNPEARGRRRSPGRRALR